MQQQRGLNFAHAHADALCLATFDGICYSRARVKQHKQTREGRGVVRDAVEPDEHRGRFKR
jgi:hypothetical protein